MKVKTADESILIYAFQCGCVRMNTCRERGFMRLQFQTALRFG